MSEKGFWPLFVLSTPNTKTTMTALGTIFTKTSNKDCLLARPTVPTEPGKRKQIFKENTDLPETQ